MVRLKACTSMGCSWMAQIGTERIQNWSIRCQKFWTFKCQLFIFTRLTARRKRIRHSMNVQLIKNRSEPIWPTLARYGLNHRNHQVDGFYVVSRYYVTSNSFVQKLFYLFILNIILLVHKIMNWYYLC